jgi:hypothetical protein
LDYGFEPSRSPNDHLSADRIKTKADKANNVFLKGKLNLATHSLKRPAGLDGS